METKNLIDKYSNLQRGCTFSDDPGGGEMTRRVCLTCRHWLRMKDDQMMGFCQDTDDLPVHSYRGQLEDCTTGGWKFGDERKPYKQKHGIDALPGQKLNWGRIRSFYKAYSERMIDR